MGYFDDTCYQPTSCPNVPFFAPGVNRTLVVLNESLLLGLTDLSFGDDVIVILPTSKTLAYGVVKFVNPGGSGWAQFTVIGNGSFSMGVTPLTAPATFTDASMFPGGVFPAAGLYFAGTPAQLWSYQGGDSQWRYSDLVSG